MRSFKKHIEEGRVTPGDLKAQAEGKKAARKGVKYDDNPYEKGSSRHLQWSKGHNAARAGMLKKEEVEQIEESTGKYKATSEKSKFGKGGYRPHLKNPEGKTSYLAGVSYKSHEHAAGEAAAYHKGYTSGPGKANERGAERAVAAYRAKNKEHMHEEVDVNEAMSLRDIKNKKEREERNKDKKTGDRYKDTKKKVYGNMMGGLKKEEAELDEVLDTPKAMDSYKNKAKASKDKATNSAVAKIMRGGDHSAELKTRSKREKGLAMADRNAAKKTFKNLRKENVELSEADIAEILHQYALSENVNADQLAALSEEEINEIIGKAIGGAFKLGAKAAVGAGRMAKKAANRMSTAGRADAAEKKAAAVEKKNKDRERIKAAQERLRKAKEASRNK